MTTSGLRRVAWAIWAVSLSLLLIGLTLSLVGVATSRMSLHSISDVAPAVLASGTGVVVATLGALIVSRQGKNSIGWIFVAVGLVIGLMIVAEAYTAFASASLPGAVGAAWFASVAQGPVLFGIFVFVFLLFPNGRLLSPRWRPVSWAASAALALVTFSSAALPGPLQNNPSIRNPFGIGPFTGFLHASFSLGFMVLMLTLAAAAASLVLRFRRSRGDERQQLKWFVSAAVLAAILLLSGPIFWFVLPPRIAWLWPVAFFLAVISIPIATGIAMLKYRLYDIDLLINRTLVYGSLTAGIVGLYVLIVGDLGNALRTGNNLGISLVATGLVAVLFQPLREHLQRGVNHMMYGERDDPYAVISRLGQRLEGTISPEALLPTVVETVAQALKLPYAAITLRQDDGFVMAAAVGTPGGEPLSLALIYQQELVGRLLLAPRAPGETFSPADYRLLADLARQASIAAHAVRLTADLQHSRQRLVTAREEERRRLRRDLHDGLGPSLAAQTLKIGSARALYLHDPAAADALLAELEDDMGASLANVRHLVYNLRPPALDELGLAGALRDSAARYRKRTGERDEGLSIRVDAPDDLPNLPAAVEVAAYRIAQEALTNVVRHAHAGTCWVGLRFLSEGDRTVLELTIADDGVGLAAERKAGVGLASMRERAAELGGTLVIETRLDGGTSVRAQLPIVPVRSAPSMEVGVPEVEAARPLADTEIANPKGLVRR